MELFLDSKTIKEFKLPNEPVLPQAAPAVPQTPLTAEEERERLGALLESQYREEWLKKFEEEELVRKF